MDSRVERSRHVIRTAALEELADRGLSGLSIDSVARRAGVARTTVYRHWSSTTDLVSDALQSLNRQPGSTPADSSPTERVRTLLLHLVAVFEDSVLAACIPALVEAAAREPRIQDFLDDYSTSRRSALVRAIADGVSDGSFPAVDPEVASQALSGAMFYRHLMTKNPPRDVDVDPLIRAVLRPA